MATVLVFADADVLTASLGRSLLLIGAQYSAYRVRWSLYAETEALRHQPSGAMRLDAVRTRYGWPLVADPPPDAVPPGPFADTDAKDRPILAATAARSHAASADRVPDPVVSAR
jgi:hypothetical protein